MMRMTRLLTVALVMLTMACSQNEEEITIIEPQQAIVSAEEYEMRHVMLLDHISAQSVAEDCKAGVASYLCLGMDEILRIDEKRGFFVAFRRPRHCPFFGCNNKDGVVGGVPGTVCIPDVCGSLLKQQCLGEDRNFQVGVRSVGPENTSAYLLSNGEVIAATTGEFGGGVLPGPECNSVTLDFGRPLGDFARAGMEIRVNTVVNLGGEPVETSFSAIF